MRRPIFVKVTLQPIENEEKTNLQTYLCGRGLVGSVGAKSIAVMGGRPFVVPEEALPGRYRLCIKADADDQIKESDEGNNVVCQMISIAKTMR